MPPPNHHTSCSAGVGASARKKRTFMCTVGTWGLRGCSTSDTPVARALRPASCGRLAEAVGGSWLTCTSENITPARSKSLPSSSTQLMPLPWVGLSGSRCQASRRKRSPPMSSRPATMRDCSPANQAAMASCSAGEEGRAVEFMVIVLGMSCREGGHGLRPKARGRRGCLPRSGKPLQEWRWLAGSPRWPMSLRYCMPLKWMSRTPS